MKKPRELQTFDGYVINSSKYRENDAVITFLSEGKKYCFRVAGGCKPTSRNHLATMTFSHLRLDVGGFEGHLEVRSSSMVEDSSAIYQDLKLSAALSLCQEAIILLMRDDDQIDDEYLIAVMKLHDAKNETLLFGLLVFLVNLLSDLGIVNKSLVCACCGEPLKKAYAIDFSLGGFLDCACARERRIPPCDPAQMRILAAAYRASAEQLAGRTPEESPTFELILRLLDHVDDALGYRLRSFENFQKWFLNL